MSENISLVAELLATFNTPKHAGFGNTMPVVAVAHLPQPPRALAAVMGSRLACGDLERTPKSNDGKPAPPVAADLLAWEHDRWVAALGVSPTDHRIAAGTMDGRIRLWKWGQEKPLTEVAAHDDTIRGLAFSHDGRHLVSGGADRQAKLWDATTMKLIASHKLHTDFVCGVGVVPDPLRLVSGGEDGKVIVWDAATQKPLHTIDFGHARVYGRGYPTRQYESNQAGLGGGVFVLDTSADGKYLAASGGGGGGGSNAVGYEVIIAEMDTGKVVYRNRNQCFGLSFHPRLPLLACVKQSTVQILEVPSGRVVVDKLSGGSSYLCQVQFSADGKQLVAGNGDGTMRVWKIDENNA